MEEYEDKARIGLYKTAYCHMLLAYELIKATEPEKCSGAKLIVERMREYFIAALDITELERVPEDPKD